MTWAAASDEPISTWAEDTLGREALVDALTYKILISKAPVIALFGGFGSGKTSTLNLLREHLDGKAIVVSFSTWLPGSEETLASYLMADIATECRKNYVVPGLRRSTVRLAHALSQSVPLLRGIGELFPEGTQRDDIANLRKALRRLPRQAVVLLDELDRMEQGELRTLLKVIRGASNLPNLCFVCAAEKETLVETVKGNLNDDSYLYFEKFFPVEITIPELGDDELLKAGTERVCSAFKSRSWFASEEEEVSFRKRLSNRWNECIAPFCRTLRAIGLLANDIGVSSVPLRREVDPIDLVLIELLRRFKPAVYEIISRNSILLTGGPSVFKGGTYLSDREKKELETRFIEEINGASSKYQGDPAKRILNELFPRFGEIVEQKPWRPGTSTRGAEGESKRISNPDMFAGYFRYELPAAIFSTVEFELFVQRYRHLPQEDQRRQLFLDKLKSMEKGSLRRDDFLNKISDAVKTEDLPLARSWTLTALTAANEVSHDLFLGLGEAGHVLRMVIRFAERLPKPEKPAFLAECIDRATDDTIPFRILTTLTNQESDGYLSVPFKELYPAFIQRMRRRYGPEVEAGTLDLSTSDPQAFNLWGANSLPRQEVSPDPADRQIEYDFWTRYVGQSKARLTRVFNEIFMPFGVYESDPTPFVENKMGVEVIRRLFVELPNDLGPADVPQKYINRLTRFLNGDFKNGIDIHSADDPGPMTHGR